MTDNRNRPTETLRDGNLKASIWENAREGNTTHSVQFRRNYRDQDGQLRDTDSFFAADLLRLSHLASRSYDRVAELRQEAKQEQRREPAQQTRRERTRSRDDERGR